MTPGGLEHGGGIGRIVENMVEAWPEQPKMSVFDTRGPGHIIFSPLYFARCLAAIALAAHRRPLLHINVAGRGSSIRKLIIVHFARLLRLPIVLHLHDANYRRALQQYPKLIRLAVISMFKRSQRVVVLGAADRDLVVTVLGVEPYRVEVVPNAVPCPARHCTTSSRGDRPHILFLGSLSRRKGVHDLIRALATEPLRTLDWRITLAGGGAHEATFKNQVNELGLRDRIFFPGWVDRSVTAAFLQSADIFVLPSYDEAMALSILEAMSYGLCVVCTPVGSHTEVIEDGISGILVLPGDVNKLADALATCVSDLALRVRLGTGARQVFEQKFDVSRYPDRMKLIYEAASEWRPRGRNRSHIAPADRGA